MDIRSSAVLKLRKLTGCGLMECKKALVKFSGDMELSKKYLKEVGWAVCRKGPVWWDKYPIGNKKEMRS